MRLRIVIGLCFLLSIFFFSNVLAFRVSRPPSFSLPWTQDQINNLNDTLESFWNLQNGEFNLDIVTSAKTNAANGDIWLIQTGSIVRIQYKAINRVFSVTPDGLQ